MTHDTPALVHDTIQVVQHLAECQLPANAWDLVAEHLAALGSAVLARNQPGTENAMLRLDELSGPTRQQARATRPAHAAGPTTVAIPDRLRPITAVLLERLIEWRSECQPR